MDIPGLVSVYVALHSLPSNPDLSRSVAITTSILVQTSPDLAKQFIEELSGNVRCLGHMQVYESHSDWKLKCPCVVVCQF